MVYNTWQLPSFQPCPSSGTPKNMAFWKLDLFLFPGERVDGKYSVGSIRKSQTQSLDLGSLETTNLN
jgi:hypothetical protein